MTEQETPERTGFDRRGFIKRAAVVGAATAWAAPTIQSLASPAFALGSAPTGGCTACLTGGGEVIVGGSYNGTPLRSISVGIGQICCTQPGPGNADPQIDVTLHPVGGHPRDDINFHFDTLLTITCSKTGNPAPPPDTADCSNQFVGTATNSDGDLLSFTFIDNGEPGTGVDYVSITLTAAAGGTATGTGTLDHGNLQVHEGLGPITRDCSGC
jgi:hypothetical protein